MFEITFEPPNGVTLSPEEIRLIKTVEELARTCFDREREFYPFHNTWDAHAYNVLKYIQEFLKITGLDINETEWTILITACIMHDVGKVLPFLHPSFQPSDPQPLFFASELLEEGHHVITFLFLSHIINENFIRQLMEDKKFYNNFISCSKNKNNKKWGGFRESITKANHPANRGGKSNLIISNQKIESKYTNFINDIEANYPEWNLYLHCAAWISLLHKQIDLKLLQTFLEDFFGKNISEPDVHSYWSNPEKLFTPFDKKKNESIKGIDKWLLEGKDAKKHARNRFEILSALLNLGDKLDISGERLQAQPFHLAVLLDDIGLPRTYERFPHPDAMARWFQFWYTQEPEIKKDEKQKKEQSKPSAKIIIPYRYPEHLRQEFPFFRYQAEKDFEDLSILAVLEEAIQVERGDEEFGLTIRREENTQDIFSLQQRNERLLYCLKKICPANNNETAECDSLKSYLEMLRISQAVNKSFFPCQEQDEKKPWEKCFLLDLVINALEDDVRASYPAWQSLTLKRPGKVSLHKIICKKGNLSNSKKLSNDQNKMIEYLKKITGKNVMVGLSPRARDGLENWKKKVTVDRKGTDLKGTLFYPFNGRTRRIPVSMDVAYLLNLFRHFRGESLSVEDIVNSSGLDRGRILMYCGRLEHEAFISLEPQSETYRFNNNRYEEVERILKSFDYKRSELVAKVHDIERFGRPLALCADENETTLTTYIKGLDWIMAPFEEEKKRGLPLRKSILLLGPPGSGKTTIALEIVRNMRSERFPTETAQYLTFEEDIRKLFENYRNFGWKWQDIADCVRSLSTLQRKAYLDNPDQFLNGFLGILDEFSPDLVVVDNLGYLLQLVPSESRREILNRLIRVFMVRGITSLLIGEDIPGGMSFEAYDVDGVIFLSYERGKRWLEITKMRGREFAAGRHLFRIEREKKSPAQKEDSKEFALRIFPNIQMHIARAQREKDRQEEKELKKKKEQQEKPETSHTPILSSGVKGLNELLPIYSIGGKMENGFESGEVILVLGSPGAGKTLLGLHFLKEGWKEEEGKEEKRKERGLWISFESDLDGLKLATRSFSDDAGFKKLIGAMKSDSGDSNIQFKFYPPAQLDPDELVNYLLDECDKGSGLDRLVLDSVTDLEQIFHTEIELKVFMTSLVQLLREKGITAMFLYRTKEFFGKTEDIGRVLASVVDTIICLKVLEFQNAVQKGLFLLKVRGREHRSKLLSLTFDEKQGMAVADRGWTMSGLISGETGDIREPQVFVKLFFEKPNEILLNSLIVHEYNRRFRGGRTTFVQVRKPQIYSEFWSFRGSSGAGHANVRVVSLCDYWAALFHKQNKLCNLWEYVSSETRQLLRLDEFWRRCASYSTKDHTYQIFAVPNYIDVGVLAFHKSIVNQDSFWEVVGIEKPKKNGKEEDRIEDARKKLFNLKWNKLNPQENKEISSLAKKLIQNTDESPRYLFAMPALSDTPTFVSFFLEIYWSFGGAVLDFRWVFDRYSKYCEEKLINSQEGLKFPALYQPPKKAPLETKSPQGQPTGSHGKGLASPSLEMQFLGEILMLVPGRVINSTIQKTNRDKPNLVGDICRCGEILFDQLLEKEGTETSDIGKASAATETENPHKIFDEKENNLFPGQVCEMMKCMVDTLKEDKIWKGQEDLTVAAEKAKGIVKGVIDKGNEQDKKHLLLILFFLLSRIITSRERNDFLLEWLRNRAEEEKNEEKFKDDIDQLIRIGPDNSEGLDTIRFLADLIDSGLSPNPIMGDLSKQALLARKWASDIVPPQEVGSLKEVAESFDLYSPPEAYEKYENEQKRGKDSTLYPYHIAPMPFYDRDDKNKTPKKKKNPGASENKNKPYTPGGKWSYAVLGLWQLGITSPALSPEIGWIFIDALTEDGFMEMRAKRGLGLPTKPSAYNRESIYKEKPEIYGKCNKEEVKGKLEGGIVQLYKIATRDKPIEESKESIERCTRERVTPYFHKLEEILGKELKRFFEPSFFDTHFIAKKGNRNDLIKEVLERIKSRIGNFLFKNLWRQ
jgi:circadian clock protein KaiC